jgi:hypothetical protein
METIEGNRNSRGFQVTDFTIFYKERMRASALANTQPWDLLLSAYRPSQRVVDIFELAPAQCKIWLLLPEYHYRESDKPPGASFASAQEQEWLFFRKLEEMLNIRKYEPNVRICVDITGFIGRYVVFLVRWLQHLGVQRFDAIYTEPQSYRRREETRFSDEAVVAIRQVAGFEGLHNPVTDSDLLLIGTGYDHRLVAEIANYKDYARKTQLLGLPSLHADMFQESILRSRQAGEALGPANDPKTYRFAPANDPFVTAEVVKEIVDGHRHNHPGANVYLSPLATKAQALGFALYFLFEGAGRPTSIIYPICESYERVTANGVSGVWRYVVELPNAL